MLRIGSYFSEQLGFSVRHDRLFEWFAAAATDLESSDLPGDFPGALRPELSRPPAHAMLICSMRLSQQRFARHGSLDAANNRITMYIGYPAVRSRMGMRSPAVSSTSNRNANGRHGQTERLECSDSRRIIRFQVKPHLLKQRQRGFG